MAMNRLKKGLVGCLLGLSLLGCSYEQSPSSSYPMVVSSYKTQAGRQDSYNRVVSGKSLSDWLNEKIENAPIPFAPPNPLERWKVILAGSVFYGAVGGGMGLLVYSLIASEKRHRRRN